jgi:hypothetical protein
MRAKYTKVRARSANEGSGTAGWSLATPVPACFLLDEEDIESVHLLFSNRERRLDCKRWLALRLTSEQLVILSY